MRRVALAGLLLACLAQIGDSADRVGVQVEGGRVRFAPASLRLKVTVEPHDDNRLLRVIADSGSFYRSTDEQLTGQSAKTRWVGPLRDLPAGDYAITATVLTRQGEQFTARDTLDVRGWGSP